VLIGTVLAPGSAADADGEDADGRNQKGKVKS